MSQVHQALLPRWDDVRFFLAVLRQGSFTRAAKALGTEQSTVSRRVLALEEQLGIILFERRQRVPVPTQAALELRETAERIEAEIGRFTDHATGVAEQPVSGRVKLALTEELAISFVVPKVLPRLRAAYPDLSVDLVTSYRSADLIGHEAEVALRFTQPTRGDLVGKRVARFATGVLCARRRVRAWAQRPTADLDWISVELDGLAAPESTWLKSVVSTTPVMTCNSYQVQLAAIRAGLGVGIGPKVFAVLDRKFATLERPELSPPALDLFLVTRRAIRHLPRVAALLDALTAEFSQLPSA